MNEKFNRAVKSKVCTMLIIILILFNISCVFKTQPSGVALPKDWPVPSLTLPNGSTLVHYGHFPDTGWRLEFDNPASDAKVTDHIEGCLRKLKYLKLQLIMSNIYFSPDGLIMIVLSNSRGQNAKLYDPSRGDFSVELSIRVEPTSMLNRAKPL
jgi:hypothetical protein